VLNIVHKKRKYIKYPFIFLIPNNTWKAKPNSSWAPIAADSLKWAQHELGIAFFSLSALFSPVMFTT
jgi:hypothetical protein